MIGSFSVTKLPIIEYRRSFALADDEKIYTQRYCLQKTAKPVIAGYNGYFKLRLAKLKISQ